MPYNPSKVGPFSSLAAIAQERNSFKIFEATELEIPAIDFERLGINTLHPKDRTLITNLVSADPKSIIGEIWPGRDVNITENTYDETTADRIGIAYSPTVNGKVWIHQHAISAEYLAFPEPEEATSGVLSDGNNPLFYGLPSKITIPLDIAAFDGRVLDHQHIYIPIIPTIGCVEYCRHSASGEYDSVYTLHSNGLGLLHFNHMTLSPTTRTNDDAPLVTTMYNEISGSTLVVSADTMATANRLIVETDLDNTSKIECSLRGNEYTAQIVENPTIDQANSDGAYLYLYDTNSGNELAYQADSRTISYYDLEISSTESIPGSSVFVTFDILPIEPAVQNTVTWGSVSSANLIEAQENAINVCGSQYFVAVPSAVTEYPGRTIDSLTIKENKLFVYGDVSRGVNAITSIKQKKLFEIDGISCYAALITTGDDPVIELQDKKYIELGFADESGYIKFPQNLGRFLEASGISDLSNVICLSAKSIGVVSEDEKNYHIELMIGGMTLTVSASIISAKKACPLMYSSSPYIADINIITTHIVSYSGTNVNLTLVDNTIPAYVQKDIPDRSTYDSGTITTTRNEDHYVSPYNVKIDNAEIYVGSNAIVKQSARLTYASSYGALFPLFTDIIYTTAHAEKQGIAAEYLNVHAFPILFPIHITLKPHYKTTQILTEYPDTYDSDECTDFHLRGLVFDPDDESTYAGGNSPTYSFLAYSRQRVFGFDFASLIKIGREENWDQFIPRIEWANSRFGYYDDDSPMAFLNLPIGIHANLGTVLLISTQTLDARGTPEQVIYAQDAIGAEFSRYSTVVCDNAISTIKGKYISNDTGIYLPSLLYQMSTSSNNEINIIAKAADGYHAVGQNIFVSVGVMSYIYFINNENIQLAYTVFGKIADSPQTTTNGIYFVAIEPDCSVLYLVDQSGVTPIYRINNPIATEQQAVLKVVNDFGLVMAVITSNRCALYSIRDAIVTWVEQVRAASYLSVIESSGGSVLRVIDNALDIQEMSYGNGDEQGFSATSSEFHFPLIEGFKPILSALKFSFDYETALSNKTFSLKVWVNDYLTLSDTNITCNVETIVRLDYAFPVGCAKYEISKCGGHLRNVAWIVYPMPLLQETIEPYSPGNIIVPVVELGQTTDDNFTIEIITDPIIGKGLLSLAFDEDFNDYIDGYKYKEIEYVTCDVDGESVSKYTEIIPLSSVPQVSRGNTIYSKVQDMLDHGSAKESEIAHITLQEIT